MFEVISRYVVWQNISEIFSYFSKHFLKKKQDAFNNTDCNQDNSPVHFKADKALHVKW